MSHHVDLAPITKWPLHKSIKNVLSPIGTHWQTSRQSIANSLTNPYMSRELEHYGDRPKCLDGGRFRRSICQSANPSPTPIQSFNNLPIHHQSSNPMPICQSIANLSILHQFSNLTSIQSVLNLPIYYQSNVNPMPIRLPTRNWAGNKFTTGTDRSVSTEDHSDSLGSIPVSIFFTIPLRIPDQSDNPMTIPVQAANHKPIYWQSTTNPQIACQSNINLWQI